MNLTGVKSFPQRVVLGLVYETLIECRDRAYVPRLAESWEQSADALRVRAGNLSAEFTAGGLRYLRVGDIEVARRIVVAVRDQAWNTVPGALSDVRIHQSGDEFRITFSSRHEAGELCFVWKGTIGGTADGSCSFSMDGSAVTSFPYRRIGICVLHPPEEFAGRGFSATGGGAAISWPHDTGRQEAVQCLSFRPAIVLYVRPPRSVYNGKLWLVRELPIKRRRTEVSAQFRWQRLMPSAGTLSRIELRSARVPFAPAMGTRALRAAPLSLIGKKSYATSFGNQTCPLGCSGWSSRSRHRWIHLGRLDDNRHRQ